MVLVSLDDFSMLLALLFGAVGGLIRTIWQNGNLGKQPLETQRARFIYNAAFGAITAGSLAIFKILELPDPSFAGFYVFAWACIGNGLMWTIALNRLGGTAQASTILQFLHLARKPELEEPATEPEKVEEPEVLKAKSKNGTSK